MEVKGILHCHSAYSYDAKLSLAELRTLFLEKGIRFACMTEHTDELTAERARAFVEECAQASDASFLFIPGFEVPYRRAHVLMIGMRSFHGTYAPSIEALRPWTSEAAFVVLAHPVRNHFAVDEGLLGEIDALEVWNQQYEGKQVPRTRSLALYEELKKLKPSLLATGGVDFHRAEHWGAPLVTMDVDALAEARIIHKLQTGAFTISSPHAELYGTLPNADALVRKYRLESAVSVAIITLGKGVNKLLARAGISLPKALKQRIRRHL